MSEERTIRESQKAKETKKETLSILGKIGGIVVTIALAIIGINKKS